MLFALTVLAAPAAHAQEDAFFVRCDRSTTTEAIDPGGVSLLFTPVLDPAGRDGITIDEGRDGRLQATVHGAPFAASDILGVDPGGLALVGIEPDEIDYFPDTDPLEGIEPDEIDVSVFLCESDCVSASQVWPAYAVVALTVDPTGATTFEPVRIIVTPGML